MDPKKLEALRRKYAEAKGGDIHDPDFKAVALSVFTAPDKRKWPFADPATLLGAPFRPDAAGLDDFGGLDVVLVGVPMDLGVTNRAGARLGPSSSEAIEARRRQLHRALPANARRGRSGTVLRN